MEQTVKNELRGRAAVRRAHSNRAERLLSLQAREAVYFTSRRIIPRNRKPNGPAAGFSTADRTRRAVARPRTQPKREVGIRRCRTASGLTVQPFRRSFDASAKSRYPPLCKPLCALSEDHARADLQTRDGDVAADSET